ncbi:MULTISPECIES: cell division ATP-binding protein FtsE [Dyadobacter]|jgi:cell division transport system ATP-binding protein|uniref:Cell division ATP-binding protein FtsE n=1 Tax=Dyadobacter chenhuakuii TaxID=2909339 RepID=A0A9X1QCJ7_9BACT|nr:MULTISPECIES: ATP-binding cassette domain-containing protein [Dyadobacter]MCE7069917.1 ATP-binding cassette domain-containing protein [Dyadobacter sp. CY327]MCF2492240.1 ATP-binding cassette domain-containing protein [Dyadobacter chenhuakuii]MCF2497329.1 ATP-binding cassette domain-containing protein [Dyadobacter chenhuakuii]MCF2516882.1 ATP-binding cassette domain-containing protein [Dyadobacter sp. CY351]USJ33452.1 ATP-binding cassette domain-containing protein [Dyadobacter chenhuakuii]
MTESTEPIIILDRADIYQGERPVLNDVHFEIKNGEFVYMIGRTGSGKSSLLKTLYADLWLHTGSAKVVGYELHNIKRSDIPFLRRKIGIVFQDFQLLSDRSVEDNLSFVLKATGWDDKGKISKRIAEVLMQVGLGTAQKRMPHQLSGGEQQRVVIARAMLNEPRILIADEPTGNLDPEVAEQIMQVFKTINNAGVAILMATHNHEFLRKFPARVLKCENGSVIEG